MHKDLNGKVIVVTGGCGLIGREFIKAIASNNGIAIIADINSEIGVKVKEELFYDFVNKIDYINLDITSKPSIQESIEFILKKFKRIDALVNCAYPKNINYGKNFFDVEYKDFCENINMHIGGYFLTSQQFACLFKKQHEGNIINLASIYGLIPPKFEIYDKTKMTMPVEYAVNKSAIIHLTKYIAKYLKGSNVRINTISPGGILNNQPRPFIKAYNSNSLNKGMLNVSDLIGTLLFLLSDESKFINGQNIIVDDGFTL